jgi:hypothetical protein
MPGSGPAHRFTSPRSAKQNCGTAWPSFPQASRAAGRPISQLDCQIAAIARARKTAVATRKTSDYEDCGIDLIDPWSLIAR